MFALFLTFAKSNDIINISVKVSNGAKIRNRYNQVPHLTQNTNGKLTNSQKTPQTRAKMSALSILGEKIAYSSIYDIIMSPEHFEIKNKDLRTL